MADDILAKGEKVVTNRPATEGDLDAFHDSMRGERYMAGGNHDLEGRGYGSGMKGNNYADMDDGTPRPEAQQFVQQPQASQEETNWQQLYGNSENEKGEWRRTAQEAMSQLEQMKAELAGMRSSWNGQPPQQQNPYGTPAPTPGYPQQQAPGYQLPDTFFPEKDPDSVVEVKDVDAMVRGVIAPAVFQLYNQQQAMERAQHEAMKQAAGITGQDEQRLTAQNPWLQHVAPGVPRIQAMQRLKAQEHQAQPQQPQQPAQQRMVAPQQAAARRVTYIESGEQKTQAEQEEPLQKRIAKEFTAAKTAFEKRKVLEKYGMARVNDYGAGFLTH